MHQVPTTGGSYTWVFASHIPHRMMVCYTRHTSHYLKPAATFWARTWQNLHHHTETHLASDQDAHLTRLYNVEAISLFALERDRRSLELYICIGERHIIFSLPWFVFICQIYKLTKGWQIQHKTRGSWSLGLSVQLQLTHVSHFLTWNSHISPHEHAQAAHRSLLLLLRSVCYWNLWPGEGAQGDQEARLL